MMSSARRRFWTKIEEDSVLSELSGALGHFMFDLERHCLAWMTRISWLDSRSLHVISCDEESNYIDYSI